MRKLRQAGGTERKHLTTPEDQTPDPTLLSVGGETSAATRSRFSTSTTQESLPWDLDGDQMLLLQA